MDWNEFCAFYNDTAGLQEATAIPEAKTPAPPSPAEPVGGDASPEN